MHVTRAQAAQAPPSLPSNFASNWKQKAYSRKPTKAAPVNPDSEPDVENSGCLGDADIPAVEPAFGRVPTKTKTKTHNVKFLPFLLHDL